MAHPSDDDLVLLHYGEAAGREAADHLQACAECRQRLRELTETLQLARPPEAPEPDPGFEARIWAALEPRLAPNTGSRRARLTWRRIGPRAALALAMAASLVVAFLLGRSQAPQPLPPEVRNRILLVAVGGYLDRSQMVLVELAAAPEEQPLDVSRQRKTAGELVSASRLYRKAAVRSGEPAVAAVLDELERVLLEVAAGPEVLGPTALEALQRRIDERGLLFKVRIIQSEIRERERETPRKTLSS
jgi:hypothetical protein